MTYFKSLEEVREWVLLHEPNIDIAYDTMVAIKALWNDGYNQVIVDSAVPVGEVPRPSAFMAEDAGDLSVSTEELQEEPPDYSTESRDPPYGIAEEELGELPRSGSNEEIEERLSEITRRTLSEPLGGPHLVLYDEARHMPDDLVTKTLSLPEGYKATLTLDPTTDQWMCGPIKFSREIVREWGQGSTSDSFPGVVLDKLKKTMPLLVVAGNHREFVHWCDQHGYQWMSLYGKVFPYAKYIGGPEEIMGYDNREQRIRFIGTYHESDAFRGTNMLDLHTYIMGSSDPELRSHIDDGFRIGNTRNQSDNSIQSVYDSLDYRTRVLGESLEDIRTTFEPFRYGDYVGMYGLPSVEYRASVLSNYARGIGRTAASRYIDQHHDEITAQLAARLDSDEPPAEGTHGGHLGPPLTMAGIEAARSRLMNIPPHTQSPEAEASQEAARLGHIYRQGMHYADYIRALRDAGEISDELANQMISGYIRSVAESRREEGEDLEPPEEEPDEHGLFPPGFFV